MSIQHHPKRGTILEVDFDTGFKPPEMVKKRLCVVVSPPIEGRGKICTVVPLSTSPPKNPAAYHYKLFIPFAVPVRWPKRDCWVKCDMVNAVGFHRLSLLRLGKDQAGKRIYQLNTLTNIHLVKICDGILASIGINSLTKDV